jgi:hypothetical protein
MINEEIEMTMIGNTMKELISTEFAEMRAARIADTATTYVVWMELIGSGNMVELDAESKEHALTLIDHFVDIGIYNTASYRKVKSDGTLGRCEEIIDRDFDYMDGDV